MDTLCTKMEQLAIIEQHCVKLKQCTDYDTPADSNRSASDNSDTDDCHTDHVAIQQQQQQQPQQQSIGTERVKAARQKHKLPTHYEALADRKRRRFSEPTENTVSSSCLATRIRPTNQQQGRDTNSRMEPVHARLPVHCAKRRKEESDGCVGPRVDSTIQHPHISIEHKGSEREHHADDSVIRIGSIQSETTQTAPNRESASESVVVKRRCGKLIDTAHTTHHHHHQQQTERQQTERQHTSVEERAKRARVRMCRGAQLCAFITSCYIEQTIFL